MPRKLPALNADNRAFWQGGEHDELLIQHCPHCARFIHPPGPVCPVCTASDVVPRAVSGKGRVLSFTVNHQAWNSELTVPYCVALIELAEQPGLRLVSNVVDMTPETVYIGMPVKVRFLACDDVWLPLFGRDE
jgi:uncharacterized OB-fold protein